MRDVPPSVGWAALAALVLAALGALLGLRQALPADAARVPLVVGPPKVEGAWVTYVAPERVCPGGDDASAPVREQLATMACLVDHARLRRGLGPVRPVPALFESAAAKAREVLRCSRFAHDPCGTGAEGAFRHAAYGAGSVTSGWGENLAVVSRDAATPRYVLNGWLESDGHRENLFRPDWTEQGLSLAVGVDVEGHRDVNLWTSHFGFRR